MSKFHSTLKAFAAVAFMLTLTSLAQAQATRTWVSGVGDDVNPCSRTAPCKTFAGAISKTAAGGEINVLDPGGYGGVTITKSITIDGGTGAGWASILFSGTNGIVVNAGVNDVVTLRNLSINGAGTTLGLNGIRFLAGKALNVENVSIFNFSSRGIDVARATSGDVLLKDVNIFNGGGTTGAGIRVTTTSGFVFASLDRVRVEGCPVGLEGANGARITATNSLFARSTAGSGIGVFANTGSEISVASSAISGNLVGMQATGGTVVRSSNNFITQNVTGLNVNGGTIRTFGNNQLDANTTNVNGALTPVGNT